MQLIKALRQQRADLVNRQAAILAAVEARGDAFSAEERTAFDAAGVALDAVASDIERHERHAETLRAVGAGVSRPDQVADRELTGGFSNLAQLANAVRNASVGAGMDERLPRLMGAATNPHMTTGDEGYEIPPAFRDQIFMLVFDDPFLSRITFEPTQSNVVSFVADQSTPWAATGVQAYWAAEAANMATSATKVVTNKGTQRISKLFAFVNADDEILEDSPRLNARLTQRASAAIRWKLGLSVMSGDGVGKPLGYRTSGALVTQTKESGQTAGTIVTKNVSKIFSRQLDYANAFWVMNQDALPDLMELAIGNAPIWTPPNAGFKEAPGGVLLGKPIVFSDQCSTVGTAGDIQFVNLDGYFASQKMGGIKLDTSIHLYFDQGIQSFRWTIRVGGQPFLSAPVSPANGNKTRSHFVEVETRA